MLGIIHVEAKSNSVNLPGIIMADLILDALADEFFERPAVCVLNHCNISYRTANLCAVADRQCALMHLFPGIEIERPLALVQQEVALGGERQSVKRGRGAYIFLGRLTDDIPGRSYGQGRSCKGH